MAKLKPVVLNGKSGIDGTTNIKIRLTHQGKSREIRTPHYINPVFMNPDGTISDKYFDSAKLNLNLNILLAKYNTTLVEIGTGVDDMDINTLADRLRNKDTFTDFIKYTELRIKDLMNQGREGYADSYKIMIGHIKKYTHKDSFSFKEITVDFLDRFSLFLSLNGAGVNTQRIYLNDIRAIFNHALDRDIISLVSPFRKFKVKQEINKKKPVTLSELKKLRIGPYHQAQQRCVDLFFLSFYFMGMNLWDLLRLTRKNLRGGYIIYRRSKINIKQTIDLKIKILPAAMQIIEKYKGRRYLLYILDENDSYHYYKSVLKETNRRLRIAGSHSGITTNLTIGLARNTWATIAIKNGISKSDIDFCLAHNLTSMTDQYIDYDQLYERTDKANEIVYSILDK